MAALENLFYHFLVRRRKVVLEGVEFSLDPSVIRPFLSDFASSNPFEVLERDVLCALIIATKSLVDV